MTKIYEFKFRCAAEKVETIVGALAKEVDGLEFHEIMTNGAAGPAIVVATDAPPVPPGPPLPPGWQGALPFKEPRRRRTQRARSVESTILENVAVGQDYNEEQAAPFLVAAGYSTTSFSPGCSKLRRDGFLERLGPKHYRRIR